MSAGTGREDARPADQAAPPGALAFALWTVAGTFVFFALSVFRPFGVHDEGLEYLLARTWALGEPLFETFQLIYPLGRYVWIGLWLDLFGDQLWVLRLSLAFLGGLIVAILYGVVTRWGCRPIAWVIALCTAIVGIATPTTFASVMVFAAALSVIASGPPSRRRLLAVAALAGVLTGWRSDSAVLMLAVAALGVVRRRRPVELVSLVLPALLLGFLPWLLIAAASGETMPFLGHTGHRLAGLLPRLTEAKSLSDPVLDALFFGSPLQSPRAIARHFVPFFLVAPPLLYSGLLSIQLIRWRRDLGIQAPILTAAAVGAAYLPQLFWERPDLPHLRAHVPIFLGVVGISAVLLSVRWRNILAGVLLLVSAVAAAGLIAQHQGSHREPYPTSVARHIGAALETGAPPWAGLPRTDADTLVVLEFAPGWYVLEDLEPGTRFLYPTNPRHVEGTRQAQRLATDVANTTNRWAITAGGVDLPAIALSSLHRHYQRRDSWQGWVLWWHPESCSHHADPSVTLEERGSLNALAE